MSFSKTLGQGRGVSLVAGAIPCHIGKVLGAEPGECCLEGRKLLEKWKSTWTCSSVGYRLSFSLEQRSSTFFCFHCAPRTERGGELLPGGCLGNEEVGMSWQLVCTSCYMLGVGLRAGADMLKRKWAMSSCPCRTICSVCTGCLVSYQPHPEIVGIGDSESMEP